MSTYTAQHRIELEIREGDATGVAGRTTTYRVYSVKLTGGDRQHGQVHTLSADLSAHEIQIDPLGVCAASTALLLFVPNKAVDVRLGASDASILSAVRFALIAATISSLWVTTGSQATTLRTELVGGSGASITVTPPIA